MAHRRRAAWTLAVVALVVAACGSEAGPSETIGPTSASTTAEPASDTTPAALPTTQPDDGEAIDPCSLLSEEEVGTLLPNVQGPGELSDFEFTQVCNWYGEVPDVLLASVALSISRGFTLEQVIDLSPLGGTGGTLEEVEGLGFPAMASIGAADPAIGIDKPFVYAVGVEVREDLIVSLVALFDVAPGSPEHDTMVELAGLAAQRVADL